MKKIFIQYIWIVTIATFLLFGIISLVGCTFTYDEEKAFQKEWEQLDKELEKKNDSN